MTIKRRAIIKWLTACVGNIARAQESPVENKAATADSGAVVHEVWSRDLRLGLSAEGHVVRLKLGPGGAERAFRARTVLSGCRPVGPVQHRDWNGGAEFVRTFVHEKTLRQCRVLERFSPAETSVRWTVEVEGSGEAWSTPIETQLAWLDVSKAKFWTAWDNPPGALAGWNDPLVPAQFATSAYRYGGFVRDKNSFCLPIATIVEDGADLGLSLVQSPEDVLLALQLRTTGLGDVFLTRTDHRIQAGRPVRFAMDLLAHEADCRAGLGWMVQRYQRFFEPGNPRAYQLDGCGTYSSYQGDLDTAKFQKMGFSLNWNARFDWPFHGLNIPLVDAATTWPSWYQEQRSIGLWRKYEQKMKSLGFHVLEYFVTTEGGNYIEDIPPMRKAKSDQDLWRDANDFIHYAIPDAVVRERDGSIRHASWFKNVVLDPGEPVWQEYLLRQARHMVKELPESDGICIDVIHWLATYNPNRDDGVSWVDDRPARSLLSSWKELLPKLASILHQAGKCVYASPLVRRLDVCEYLDGFYDEYGQEAHILNQCGLLGLRKPVIGWTSDIDSLRPDPDALFQRHLHMGVFPAVPYPSADHCIRPDPWAEQYYLDYGPLLSAMRGKRWVLLPRVVTVVGETAKANLFEVPGGFALPVTFGGDKEEAKVVLRHLARITGEKPLSIQALQPGRPEAVPVASSREHDALVLNVPLHRGCALIRIQCA